MISSPSRRGKDAEDELFKLFSLNNWRVKHAPRLGPYHADLLVSKGDQAFVVEIKSLSEGRSDRVIPLLSQAILQARAYARQEGHARPLAVIYVESVSRSLRDQVHSFAKKFAADVAVGIVSNSGLKHFEGYGLESLNAEPVNIHWSAASSSKQAINPFSDLNQWMLKVLLAPLIPENLLNAPHKFYRNASELAGAAHVSNMSASRFVKQLKNEGFLENSSQGLMLVRRAELFRRWQSAVLRPSLELPMRFLIKGSAQSKLHEIIAKHQACLGLFAAARALQFGHVMGVPPYIYVPALPRPDSDEYRKLVPASPSEEPDVILRQPSSPKSVFRGAVVQDGVRVSDIIQVWLDVSAHPSRGKEQADLIYKKVLRQIVGGELSE